MAKVRREADCLSITVDWLEFIKLVGGTVTDQLRAKLPGYKGDFDRCQVSRIEMTKTGIIIIRLYYNCDKIV
jgi:hypothetical protein